MNGMSAVPAPVSRSVDDPTPIAADVQRLLLEGHREHAADRFGDLVAARQRRANRLAYYYLGDAADADEAVQDAFVKVFAHLPSFNGSLSFDAWFARILVNTCLDRLKSRRRRWHGTDPMGLDTIDGIASGEPSAERRLLAAAAWRRVVTAVRELPSRQRDAFMLCHLHDATPGEAAAALGMHPATFRVHLFRATRKVRDLLGAS